MNDDQGAIMARQLGYNLAALGDLATPAVRAAELTRLAFEYRQTPNDVLIAAFNEGWARGKREQA